MASAVVLAALAAPLDSTTPRSLVSLVDAETDGAGRNQRLAEYLLMTKAPTRDLLMRELVRGARKCAVAALSLLMQCCHY